ncbi:MAG: PIN domain-containing protein [Congregibacter sp.]|nr:PIN domain-containing protein [Congregibacter sp.]
MILVDATVWIDHLRRDNDRLRAWLENGEVLVHDYVIVELACGFLSSRRAFLARLHQLPKAPVATNREVLSFIETYSLMGSGLNFVDIHLLASSLLNPGVSLWSHDVRLQELAGAALH